MSNHKNLIWYNKEGDYLNLNYSESNDRFEGTLLFNENSTDTFKTYGLYMFEKVKSFEYEVPGELTISKFQLFNQYGFDIHGSKYATQSIKLIEPVNNDPEFFSKWIWGDDFESKFPIGTHIVFDTPFLEFTNPHQTYIVVSSKKNAIMIISIINNQSFESTYYSIYNDPSQYSDIYISGINAIGIYDYVDISLSDNLSNWNESSFYDKYYIDRRLNIVNSPINNDPNSRFLQKVVTVVDDSITDSIYFEYQLPSVSLPSNSNLILEIVTKTDLPLIYNGPLTLSSNTITFNGVYPSVMKPGSTFKVNGSSNNTSYYTVSPIDNFTSNNSSIYYATHSYILYNSKIYECILAYTQSGVAPTSDPSSWSLTDYVLGDYTISPTSEDYWMLANSLPISETFITETLLSSQVYLNTNKLYFEQSFTQSQIITLASAVEKYVDQFKIFNIELYYENNVLHSDLAYPSRYADVNFYHTQVGTTYSIGGLSRKYERVVRVEEELITELNYDFSENFDYNIVLTDLDEYGLIIKINKMVYQEEIAWVYSGIGVDMERTIDRTLRNWLTTNHLSLVPLGIFATLQYIGSGYSIFFNSIKLKTEYPNVPIEFEVLVGSTADFYIEHSRVLFNDMGGYLSVKINNRDYSISATSSSPGTYSIPLTLQNWYDEYHDLLVDFGIYSTIINNMIKFDVKEQDKRLEYSFSIGKSTLPGLPGYSIIRKMRGNVGTLITSNEVQLLSPTYSLESAGFATGMVVSLNSTLHPLENQEYAILGLDPDRLNLSYEGPFWGSTESICSVGPFTTIAFNLGFGATSCVVPIIAGGTGGPFNLLAFTTSMFSISYNPNDYIVNTYNLGIYSGTSNMVDIEYVQLSNSLYALGDDITVMDSYLAQYLDTISLPGNTQSRHLKFNTVNNYLYSLSKNKLWVIDPLLNVVVNSISLASNAYDIEFNSNNGDVYISYDNNNIIHVYNSSNTLVNTIYLSSGSKSYNMSFNEFEGDMYIITDDSDKVLRIDGSSRNLQSYYTIPGLSSMSPSAYNIYYEPVNESIYVWGGTNLYKIDNSTVVSITNIQTQGFNDILFNNLTGQIYISDSEFGSEFKSIDIYSNSTIFNSGASSYGYIALNQYDGDIYLSSQSINSILVIDPTTGNVKYTVPLSNPSGVIVYNSDRNSIWTIQPDTNSLIEVDVILNSYLSTYPIINNNIDESQYGTLNPDYEHKDYIWLKTRDYIRSPRENFNDEPRVKYYYKWMTDNVPELFLYDYSGDQLPITGSYAYTGEKPLQKPFLNKYPNKNINSVSLSYAQQTIFDKVYYTLDHVDEEESSIYINPEPIQTFIGFNSGVEGSLRSILQLYKNENIDFSITTTSTNNDLVNFRTFTDTDGVRRGEIKLGVMSSSYFVTDSIGNIRGLKVGQVIRVDVIDKSNSKRQYSSVNSGRIFRIKNVYNRVIIVDFIRPSDSLSTESTIINDFPKYSNITYLSVRFRVMDKEIARFNVLGQTEEEDIRFKIELGNVGKLIGTEEIFIFKEYDIYEGGVDWIYLNSKRKEMLMQKHLIYPYIGSYKSIINAINFFGYNDLELNEYYRNIDQESDKYGKLFKVEIPDIFDNTVEGWTENDFIRHTFPNPKFDTTNLFNLTYKITDKQGVNVLLYSIKEVQIKLQGLKYWLEKNIVPLTHKIIDITGRTDFVGVSPIQHRSFDIHMFNIKQNMSPVSFKMNEAYLMPINNGSTQYNCVLDFYLLSSSTYSSDLSTFPSPSINSLPDSYYISVRTYKTYPEWNPFVTYNMSDKVTYYGKLYESVMDSNKIRNPRKYEAATTWKNPDLTTSTITEIPTINSVTYSFVVGQVYEYNRDYYVYSGIGISSATSSTYSSISPNKDPNNWMKVTEWKEIDFVPVQQFSEFRSISNILPYNFTIDSNIDPFLVIEVTSDNGYGQIYRDRKNYEIRGLLDIRTGSVSYDPIGPFVPISPITTSFVPPVGPPPIVIPSYD
jgi:hypothetical protein